MTYIIKKSSPAKPATGRPLKYPWDTIKPGESFDTKSKTANTQSNGNQYLKRNGLKGRKFIERFNADTKTYWVYCVHDEVKKKKR